MKERAEVFELVWKAFQRARPGQEIPGYDGSIDLYATGIVDSFAIWDMIASVEKTLGVQVPDGQTTPQTFGSITNATDYFMGLLSR